MRIRMVRAMIGVSVGCSSLCHGAGEIRVDAYDANNNYADNNGYFPLFKNAGADFEINSISANTVKISISSTTTSPANLGGWHAHACVSMLGAKTRRR